MLTLVLYFLGLLSTQIARANGKPLLFSTFHFSSTTSSLLFFIDMRLYLNVELASTVKAPRNGSSSPSSSSSISGSVPHHTSSGIAPPLMTLSPPVEFNQEVEKGKAKEKSKEKSQEKLKDKSKDNKAKKDDKGKEGDLEAEGVAERDNSESESSNSVALGRELSCEDDVSFTSASRSASINTKIDLDDDASVVRSIRISTKVKR